MSIHDSRMAPHGSQAKLSYSDLKALECLMNYAVKPFRLRWLCTWARRFFLIPWTSNSVSPQSKTVLLGFSCGVTVPSKYQLDVDIESPQPPWHVFSCRKSVYDEMKIFHIIEWLVREGEVLLPFWTSTTESRISSSSYLAPRQRRDWKPISSLPIDSSHVYLVIRDHDIYKYRWVRSSTAMNGSLGS